MSEITLSAAIIILINILITITLLIPGLIGHYIVYPIISYLKPSKPAIVQGYTSLVYGMVSIGLYQFIYIIPLIKLCEKFQMFRWVEGIREAAFITILISSFFLVVITIATFSECIFPKNDN
jgi:hypothetical protein